MLNKTVLTTSGAAVAAAFGGQAAAESADFAGFYFGAQVGLAKGELEVDCPVDCYDLDGNPAGVFAGYNHDAGGFIIGVELAHTGDLGEAAYDESFSFEETTDLKLKFGTTVGKSLIYGVVGATRTSASFTDAETFSEESANGTLFGVGAEMGLGQNGFFGVELLNRNYGNQFDGYIDGGNVQTVSLRAGFRF